jgi:hypothetical protein
MVDAADARIRRDELVRELSDRFHEGEFTTEVRRQKA